MEDLVCICLYAIFSGGMCLPWRVMSGLTANRRVCGRHAATGHHLRPQWLESVGRSLCSVTEAGQIDRAAVLSYPITELLLLYFQEFGHQNPHCSSRLNRKSK